MKKYTSKEIRFLEKNIVGRSYAEMTNLFNQHFGLQITMAQIKYALHYYKLRNGLPPCRFKPGNIPWNKKGIKPVGSERIDEGYVEIKTHNSKTWKLKHRVIWEKANGRIPRGHVVIFADGDRQNVMLENLLLVSRKELMVMNRLGLIFNHRDLTETGKAITYLHLLINEKLEAKPKKTKGRHYETP
jgi:hypothetical protein